jgi:hypothetical protein
MKLILHIGMGKTGTTSIQQALNNNANYLIDQKTQYIGMWFGMIKPQYDGFQGTNNLLKESNAEQAAAAHLFFKSLASQQSTFGTEKFILSNEAIFAQTEDFLVFLRTLNSLVDLELVAYMRDPHEWLPSAYTQWGLHHKTNKGPIQPFSEKARSLMKMYEGFHVLNEHFPNNSIIRRYDNTVDVVQDFAQICGIVLEEGTKRLQARNEPAEILLRAAFNNRLPNEVLPNHFEAVVLNPRRGVNVLSDFMEMCFNHDNITEIVNENEELFEKIRATLGPEFDFLSGQSPCVRKADFESIQKRLLDFLVEIAFTQGERIKILEKKVKQLEEAVEKH